MPSEMEQAIRTAVPSDTSSPTESPTAAAQDGDEAAASGTDLNVEMLMRMIKKLEDKIQDIQNSATMKEEKMKQDIERMKQEKQSNTTKHKEIQDQVPRAGNSPSGQTLLKQHPLKHYYIHFYYIISFPCLVHFSIHIDPSPALTGWCRASHWLLAHVGSHAVMFVSSLTRPRARTGSQCMSSPLGVSGPPLLRDISSPLIMTAHSSP